MGILDIFKGKKKLTGPWLKYYTKEDINFKVPDVSIYEFLKERSKEWKHSIAYNYFGKTATFDAFIKEIDEAARSFRCQGIRPGDVVTVCMPNTPEAIISFYALNKIGAVANMIHPLSGEQEIKEYLVSTNSVMLVMVDLCYEKVKNIIKETNVYKTIVISVKDSMPVLIGMGYFFTRGFKVSRPSRSEDYLYWKDFIRKGHRYHNDGTIQVKKDMPAVILHSGGTTGSPKGIVLSNANFNVLSFQIKGTIYDIGVGDRTLAILPVFHGFGLCANIHLPLTIGATVVPVPQLDAKKFDKLLEKYRPTILFGVPTLYEAMCNIKNDSLDLSFVKYVISGGDSLKPAAIRKVDLYLREHNSKAVLSQGYGMTESVSATAVALKVNKEGSIGIPLPGNFYKVVTPNTQEEVQVGEDGEICVSGPSVMLGYLNNEKETNEILQIHKDGHVWLHTGDIGYMDSDGVFFYKQRLKRMLIVSGYNVYPSHVESVIEEHAAVMNCTVIGIPHPYKVQVPKAFIVLNSDYKDSYSVKKSIKEHCEKNLAKYAIPAEFEFRQSLPKTMIGKVDFKQLQVEEDNKRKDS